MTLPSLPEGNVRALIAVWFSAVTGYLWAVGATVPPELLVTTTGVVSYYFASRDKTQTQIAGDANVTLAKPYVPGDLKDEDR